MYKEEKSNIGDKVDINQEKYQKKEYSWPDPIGDTIEKDKE